jgi:type I restriction enzyme S subunit
LGVSILSGKYRVSSGAVLISKLNPHIPRVWLTNVRDPETAICSTEFMVIVPKRALDRPYLYAFFSSQEFFDRFGSLVTGTSNSHQRVKPQDLVAMQVVCPPASVRDQLAALLEPLMRRITAAIEESHQLAAMRKGLMGPLLSGEITPEAVRITP